MFIVNCSTKSKSLKVIYFFSKFNSFSVSLRSLFFSNCQLAMFIIGEGSFVPDIWGFFNFFFTTVRLFIVVGLVPVTCFF